MNFPPDPNVTRPHPHGDPLMPRDEPEPDPNTVDQLLAGLKASIQDARVAAAILIHENESLKREKEQLIRANNELIEMLGEDEGYWQDGDIWSDDYE